MTSVLIVEDDAFIRDITTIKCTEHGYEVTACGDGEAALAAFDSKSYDVVLLDLDLPGISGLELLSTIRAHVNGSSVKFIVFTNSDDETLKQKIAEMNVSGLFYKSSTLYPELFELIDGVVS